MWTVLQHVGPAHLELLHGLGTASARQNPACTKSPLVPGGAAGRVVTLALCACGGAGIAGGTHIQFDMDQQGEVDEVVERRKGRPLRDGRKEKAAREAREKVEATEREAKKLLKKNDAVAVQVRRRCARPPPPPPRACVRAWPLLTSPCAVQSAKERYLARKKAKTST